jgi:hypothetical protein
MRRLFAGLRKIREYQRGQLPFLKSLIDYDIVIEIGYAEECGNPATFKELLLLDICSRATLRRKLAQLDQQEIVIRSKKSGDRRASVFVVSPTTLRLLTHYSRTLKTIATGHFKQGRLNLTR